MKHCDDSVPVAETTGERLGVLTVTDDDDIDHVFAVSSAEYSLYEEDGLWWFTLRAAAPVKISPSDDWNPEPFVEVNIFSSGPTRLEPGSVVAIASYDEQQYNLTDLYYGSHLSFDGTLKVVAVEAGTLSATIAGEAEGEPATLEARFRWNPELRRSFN